MYIGVAMQEMKKTQDLLLSPQGIEMHSRRLIKAETVFVG